VLPESTMMISEDIFNTDNNVLSILEASLLVMMTMENSCMVYLAK